MIVGQEASHRGNGTNAFVNYVKGLLTALTLNLDTKAAKYQNSSQRSLFLMPRITTIDSIDSIDHTPYQPRDHPPRESWPRSWGLNMIPMMHLIRIPGRIASLGGLDDFKIRF